MPRNSKNVLKLLARNRRQLRRYGVERLGLFGSCVRNEMKPASDLDFVVEFRKKSFDDYMDLKEYLEKLFHCPVDLVLADAIKPRLKESILREAIHAPGL